MKGDHETNNSINMFPKFHHYQHQQQQPPPQQQNHHQLHRHLSRECQASEEDESRSSVGGGGGHNNNNVNEIVVFSNKKIKKDDEPINNSGSSGGGGDGATIEIVRRPRGRPPGSKNKPKPQVIITQTTTDECAMRTHLLEIPAGLDVITAISRFSRRRDLGLCILSGSGTVANVSLRQPSTTPGATVTFHGRFDLLSISATFLPPSSSLSSVNGFTISLAGAQGQIFGGSVVGSLVAAGTVYIVATSFDSPSYHRLPIEDDVRNPVSSGGGAAPGSGGYQTPVAVAGGDTSVGSEERESSHPSQQTDQSCSMSMYHLPSDVIWAPTPRQPPPPPPF